MTPEQKERQRIREQERQRKAQEKAKRDHIRQLQKESYEASRGPVDLPFLVLVILLTSIGLIMLFSASFPSAYYENGNPTYYFFRQGLFAVVGLFLMMFIGRINYQRFRGAARLALWGSIALLVLVIVPGVGITRNHATRWLGVGELFTFQPSELAKLGVILYFSDTISRKKDKMRNPLYGIAPYAAILLIISVLMMMEPHLSGTVLILGIGAVLMFVGGIPWSWVLGVLALAGGGVALLLSGVIPYGQSRIAMWRDPWIDKMNDGWQMVQSYLAIGSGGLLGVGLGKSRQKYLYLPEEHNDFIFAVVCEELGLIGAAIIMLLFAALILRGYWIALQARDRFGSLLAVGVTTLIALQTLLNIAVVTGAVPATGISLPFFSYGGTALLIQLAEMGIVLSVSRQMKAPPG